MKFNYFVVVTGILFARVTLGLQEDNGTLTHQISTLYFDVQEFQNSLGGNQISGEKLMSIIKDLSSTLILMLSELESSKSFEQIFASKFRELQSELNDFKGELNETNCSLSTRIIDIENELSKLKPEESHGRGSVLKQEGPERPRLTKRNFLLTPLLRYSEARNYCRKHGSKPFVPQSKEELEYIVERTTIEDEYGWIPLSDIFEEGIAEWDDGTLYELGPLRLQFVDGLDGNTYNRDCVDVNKKGRGDWYDCHKTRRMLCVITE